MLVFVHSLGSLWQQKTLPAGGIRIWNTTGIRDGPAIRSCAKVFGQVAIGARARVELARTRDLSGGLWITNELSDRRKLKLLCRAPGRSTAEWYLTVVTETLVGELQHDSWDASLTTLLSFSKWKSRQELMLLMRPFAWLRGSQGSAVLTINASTCRWLVEKW